jgi:hypothetical protein
MAHMVGRSAPFLALLRRIECAAIPLGARSLLGGLSTIVRV